MSKCKLPGCDEWSSGGYCCELHQLYADNDRLKAALEDIAKQKLTKEIEADDEDAYEHADFEGAYDHIVRAAREAVAKI